MDQSSAFAAYQLTADQVADYQRDGFLVVEHLLAPEVALTWKEKLKARLVAEGKLDEPSGVRVWMGRNSPRISAGASGLRSKLSSCERPPDRKM